VPPGFTAVSASTAPGGYLYVLGTAPCPDAPCSSLLRSDDDGATWVQIPAPEAEVVTDAFTPGSRGDLNGQRVDTIRDVRFATPRDGWAFGGALWETHDGGATWTRARGAPGQVLDVVVDGDRILVAATDCQQEDCDSSLELRSAGVRGGELRADPGRVWPGVDRARFTSGSGTVLLLVGATDTVVYAMDDGRPVEITQPCASVPGRGLADVTPAASGPAGLVAWCAEGEGPASGNLYATTRRSTDGGRSWTTTGEDLHATNGVVSATAATLDRLVFTSGDFMYGGPVQVSRNGGGDWSRSRGPSPRSGWRWVAATGADRVLALPLDPGMLYESTDGGASFTARPFG